MGDLAMAALANMDLWVRKGIPAPSAPRMKIDPGTKLGVKDANGNTEGGLGTAQLDVPLARNGDYEEKSPACGKSSDGRLKVSRFPFTKVELAMLYKNQADYLARFQARVGQMVADRWLLPAEAENEIEEARAEAAFR